MKNFTKVITITLSLICTTLYANESLSTHNESTHNTHQHKHGYESLKNEISKKSVEDIAKAEVQRLSLAKKIHRSWKNVPISMIGKTHYGDSDDWKVGFTNPKIKNKKRQTLYIFISTRGQIRGANYTGE